MPKCQNCKKRKDKWNLKALDLIIEFLSGSESKFGKRFYFCENCYEKVQNLSLSEIIKICNDNNVHD